MITPLIERHSVHVGAAACKRGEGRERRGGRDKRVRRRCVGTQCSCQNCPHGVNDGHCRIDRRWGGQRRGDRGRRREGGGSDRRGCRGGRHRLRNRRPGGRGPLLQSEDGLSQRRNRGGIKRNASSSRRRRGRGAGSSALATPRGGRPEDGGERLLNGLCGLRSIGNEEDGVSERG